MFSQRVKEVMDRKVLTAEAATSVLEAARLMRRRRVGAVVVVDAAGKAVGIFTERDALFRVVARQLDPSKTLLGTVMTPDPRTVGPNDSFGAALVTMFDAGFRHLPVVADGALVGIISSRSALDPDLVEFRVEEERRKHFRRERRA
jgi:CBS domain-containing protein